MSIIRIDHNRSNPYVMVNRVGLEDENISWEAKGLWAYLLSRPNNWEVRVSHLQKIYGHRGGGRDAILKMIKELIDNGYCQKKQRSNGKGQFFGVEYVIYEFKIISPQQEKPYTGLPDAVNPPPTNKGNILKKEKTNSFSSVEGERETLPSKKKSVKPKEAEKEESGTKHGAFVRLKDEFYRKIVTEHGIDVVTDLIESINDHCTNNRPGGYRNYESAFRTFLKNYKAKTVRNGSNFDSKSVSDLQARCKSFSMENVSDSQNMEVFDKYVLFRGNRGGENKIYFHEPSAGDKIKLAIEKGEFYKIKPHT